jgi:hypothetical protein
MSRWLVYVRITDLTIVLVQDSSILRIQAWCLVGSAGKFFHCGRGMIVDSVTRNARSTSLEAAEASRLRDGLRSNVCQSYGPT